MCTAGNVSVDDEVRSALSWLDLVRAPEVPVSRGAERPITRPHSFTPETHGLRGVGHAVLPGPTRDTDPRDGARLWVDLARRYPGRLVAILTGPASTFAGALEIEPDLPRLLGRLVIMGGTFFGHPGNTTPASEWNVDVDPEAADVVCLAYDRCPDAPRPLWCGLDLTEQALFTPEHLARLRMCAPGSELVRHAADALRFYFEFHDSVGEGYLAQVHDPAVVALALAPDRVMTTPVHLRVECDGRWTRGMTVTDVRGHRGFPPNALVATGVAGGMPALVDRLVDDLGALALSLDGTNPQF